MHNILNCGKWLVLILICSFSSCNDTVDPTPSIILGDFDSGKTKGEIDNAEIDEASGMASSRNFTGKIWVHNDSGDKNRLFLINNDGKWQNTYYLNGAVNRDWEDVAISKFADGENYIFVADIGDNEASYGNEYNIYKLKEPKTLPSAGTDVFTSDFQTIKFKYADGARDAETLLIDHATKDLYIVTKRESRIRVYQLPYPQSISSINTANFITELQMGGEIGGLPTGATGGDISPDNTEIIIKSYFQIFYWKLTSNETILQALKRNYDKLLPYSPEPQGEGIGFESDNSGFYTIGEAGEAKNIVQLYFHKRK